GRFGLPVVGDLGHAQLDLVGLGLLGEDGAERLRVHVGQLPARYIPTVVGVAASVGELDAAAAQVVELVEPAHGSEPDAVVELADLLQGPRRVLRHEKHTAGVRQRHHAATAGDSFARELRTLAHRLLGRDEIWKAHESPRASCDGPDDVRNVSAPERLSITSRASSAMRSSGTSSAGSAPRTTAVG